MNFDPYQILNVTENSNISEIRTSFMNISRKAHPDKGGDPVVFMNIKKAYDYLIKLKTLSENSSSFVPPSSLQSSDTSISSFKDAQKRFKKGNLKKSLNKPSLQNQVYSQLNQQLPPIQQPVKNSNLQQQPHLQLTLK